MSTKYQKRPKIACVACGLFGIAQVDSKGFYTFRPHKVNGKLCKGSGKIGFVVTEEEWFRNQANYRPAQVNCCGNCAHRMPIEKNEKYAFMCPILHQAVVAIKVCKHHKPS